MWLLWLLRQQVRWRLPQNSCSYFSTKTYVMSTHLKHLAEALLMSTHNIWFHEEIRKISAFLDEKKRFICCYGLPDVAFVLSLFCSSSLLLLVFWRAVLNDCGISWVSLLILFDWYYKQTQKIYIKLPPLIALWCTPQPLYNTIFGVQSVNPVS